MDAGQIAGDTLDQAAFSHVIADIERARKTDRVGAPMAFDDHAIQSQKHPTIDLARIELILESLEGAARKKIAKTGHE